MRKPAKFIFNSDEAKGAIEIVPGPYGVDIVVNGRIVGMVDLFYLSNNGMETLTSNPDLPQQPHARLVALDADGGDEFAVARYLETDVQLEINWPVEIVGRAFRDRSGPEFRNVTRSFDPSDYIYGRRNS